MTATSFLRLLPALGYPMKPCAFGREIPDALGENTPYLRVTDKAAVWVVPVAEADRYFQVAAEMFANHDLVEKGMESGKGYREHPISLPAGEAGIVRLAEFLKSGLIGGIVADGSACVFNRELARVCSPFREEHNLERDLAELSREKQNAPGDALLMNYIGKMLIETGKTAAAGESFRAAAESNPDYAEPLSNLGALLWSQGSRQEALHMFAEAMLRNPFDVDTQDNFIRAGFEAGEMARMKSCLNQVRNRFPDCLSLDYLNAVIGYRLGDGDGCRALLQGILADDPDNARARELLGQLPAEA